MHFSDVLGTVFLFAVAISLEVMRPHTDRFFVERDPSLSYPLVSSTVPTWALGLIAFALPMSVLAAAQALDIFGNTVTHTQLQGAFLYGQAMQFSSVGVIKSSVGRLRPNFFALCNYKGYAQALAGDAAAMGRYLETSQPGRIGKFSDCLSDSGQGHLSFPSGHSSHSFAGMVFLGLCLFSATSRRKLPIVYRVCALLGPMSIAVWVACTRIIDHWHNVDDVLTGVLIGCTSAWLAFYLHMAPCFSGGAVAVTEDVDTELNTGGGSGGKLGQASSPFTTDVI